MMDGKLNRRHILEMIASHHLTSEEGIKLIGELNKVSSKAGKKINQAPGFPAKKYYISEWAEQDPVATGTGETTGTILLFVTGQEMLNGVEDWIKSTEEKNIQVVLVMPGESYQFHRKTVYQINLKSPVDYEKLLEDLKRQDLVPGRIIYMWPEESFSTGELYIEHQLDRSAYSLLYLSQAMMKQRIGDRVRLVYAYKEYEDKPQPCHSAVSGLARSIRAENPNLVYKVVGIGNAQREHSGGETIRLLDVLLAESEERAGNEAEVRYEGGRRYVKQYTEYNPAEGSRLPLPLKEKGVYLITGGAGGLGFIFAEYLAGKAKARLVLTGRSDLTAAREKRIKELEKLGAQVVYIKSDITKKEEADNLIRETKRRFKGVNGVLHGAGAIRDSFILKKTGQEMAAVLGPKVYGTVNVDETTKDEELDFFVMFSSLTAVTGNIGQSDYAYANSFMDSYAQFRIKEKRPGKTLSINWPLWIDGGIRVSEEKIGLMREATGLTPLSKESGLKAFEEGLMSLTSQIIVLEGEEKKIKDLLNRNSEIKTSGSETRLGAREAKELEEKMQDYIKKLLSRTIRLPVSKINIQEPFEKYGIDSVIILELNKALEKDFGELSKTLFFEYQNIAELAGYFTENHTQELLAKIRWDISGRDTKSKEKYTKKNGALTRPRFIEAPGHRVEEKTEEIAVIGIGGRYPMADNLKEYWKNIKDGKDCITEIPADRWDYRDYYDPDKEKKGCAYSKWGGFINNVDKFDPLFFNISPQEAELMDPQERLFLETAWHTMEDAGYTRADLAKAGTGVFVGVMYGQYQLFEAENGLLPVSSYASMANRASYCFNLQGPSIALDTMCSSSLTAIHLACEDIRRGEINLAIAGGVNVTIHPKKYILLSQGRYASTDGRCRSFGEGGDGYVPGEGVGAVLLKPLKKAVLDKDHIYAVIKGSSINHGGKTNGYSVPNPKAQAKLIRKALEKSKTDPRTISYIEAHGTGTSLGDPIEITGLAKAFREYTVDKQFCSIGSVKSNIGHLESAAGIAGITKVILQMKNKQLAPSIHAEKLNSNINFEDSPFYVQRELSEWKQPVMIEDGLKKQYPRRAGISSFGAGGSNAHIILEEYES